MGFPRFAFTRRVTAARAVLFTLVLSAFVVSPSFSLPGGVPPIWVSYGGTQAWQIDADTHAVLRSVALPDGVRAMAVDPYDHSLWVLSETRLVQFSAGGGVMVDTSLATYIDPGETGYKPVLNPYGGNLWVGAGKTLLRLNPQGTPDIVTRLPDGIRQLAMGLDETLWVLTRKELLSLAPQGGIARRTTLAALGFVANDRPESIAVDTLGKTLWLSAPRTLARVDLATFGAPQVVHTRPSPQPQFISPIALNAFDGSLSVATGDTLLTFDRAGTLQRTLNLAAWNVKKPRGVVFEPQSETLWLGANGGLIAHLSASGTLLAKLTTGSDPQGQTIFGVMPAHLLPTLKLKAPASGSRINYASPQITLTLGASCNSRVCDIGEEYLSTLDLAISLDGIAVPASAWTITGNEAIYQSSHLTEGVVDIEGTATDFLGHVSATLHDNFVIDLPPVISVSSPINGALTNNPQQTLLGAVNEPVQLTLNGTPVATTPPNQLFNQTITLVEGVNNYTLLAIDSAGNQTTYSFSVTLDSTPPAAPTAELGELIDGQVAVSGTAEAGGTVTVTNVRTGASTTLAVNAGGAYATQIAAQGGDTLRIVVTDAAGNISEQAEVEVPGGLPPDPSLVAPLIDPTVSSIVATTTEFLYSGSNPIQTGVAPGTIDPVRVTVLRGKVLDRDNAPINGVTITIHDHPEFGQTLSRADGMFDMAVNGGGVVVIDYQKAGFLPVQRKVEAEWQDFAFADDVVMTPLDSLVTPIEMNAATFQVARGSAVTDADGTRTATILFPAGTQATMTLPDGTVQALSAVSVRATEYSVGTTGPQAMPGELPPTTGYTYAVELSTDEAMAAGAREVTFNQPVYSYVENFLGFPVGGIVPAGYYDRTRSQWRPSNNGRVIKVLSIVDGLAVLDATGDNLPDTAAQLAAISMTDAERSQLATVYSPGTSLWRVPVTHFTPWDYNWPYGPVNGAAPPGQEPPEPEPVLDDPACKPGSVIECQNQILGERLGVAGTGFTLHYASDRVPGRKNSLFIPLTGPTPPTVLRRIKLEIYVAGQRHSLSFARAANLGYRFDWDGKDAYGRTMYGSQMVRVRIGYVYGLAYRSPSSTGQSFDQAGGAAISISRQLMETTFWQESRRATTAPMDARTQGLGGWTLSEHHSYDAVGGVLRTGNGQRRNAANVNAVISTVAGTGSTGFFGDGGKATSAGIYHPQDVAFDAAGNMYIADFYHARIRKVTREGIISTFAGNGSKGSSGDGGLATQAALQPVAVAVDVDGNVYAADSINGRIRKISTDGRIRTVATASLPEDVAVDASGNIYIAARGNRQILKVNNNGSVRALASNLAYPRHVAVDGEGNVYYSDDGARVRKITPAGAISTIVGYGGQSSSADGIPAVTANTEPGVSIAADKEGNIYIGLRSRIRKIDTQGIIRTIAGNGTMGFGGDGGPALAGMYSDPGSPEVGPDGALYWADSNNNRVRKVSSALPALTMSDIVVPSEDGGELYVFTYNGKHLQTLEAKTGSTLYTFEYDSAGLLARVVDGDGNITRIERGVDGVAIVAPDGQRTRMAMDANGYLAELVNPADEAHLMDYTADGLLTRFVDPRNNASVMEYDGDGNLTRDANAANGSWTLERAGSRTARTVAMTSAEGISTSYLSEILASGIRRTTTTHPDGTQSVTLKRRNGSTTHTAADGTISTRQDGPDPRFRMQAPLPASTTVTTPGGLAASTTTARTATLAVAGNPLSLTTETTTTTVNGRAFVTTYTAADRQYSFKSPLNRTTTLRTDAQGRPLFSQVSGLDAVNYAYDTRGRLTGVTQGSGATLRSLVYGYGTDGFVSTITDAQSRQTLYQRDAVGRITQATLPGSRVIGTAYDAAGNVTGITPPGQPEHRFAYSAVNLAEQYTPPTVSGVSTPQTQYAYNRDKQLTSVVRPDGVSLVLDYDTGGRLATLTPSANGAAISYGYHATTGQLASLQTLPSPLAGEGPGERGPQTLTYTWDGFLLKDESLAGAVSGTISRNYDSSFRTTQISVNGSAVSLGYDNDDLLTSAGAMTLSRNTSNGLLATTTLGSVTTANTYNAFGELATHNAKHGGSTLFATGYTYDTLGRIATKAETIGGVTSNTVYGYDLAGRLQTVTKNGVQVESYSYDANGNRTGGTYDNQDRLLAYGANTYTWTANGELQTKTAVVGAASAATTFTYDVYGNLQTVLLPSPLAGEGPGGEGTSTRIDYLTDARNRRIGKQVNGTTVQAFLYQDQLRIAAELDGSNNVVSRFVYGTKINVPEYMQKGGNTYRIVTDHLGSVRLVIDTVTGSIAQRMDYDSFGNVTNDTNPGFQPFGFAGGLYDKDTKLVRFGARDYDAETGRWTAKDPIGFGGGDSNIYAYVGSEPINFTDPSGLTRQDIDCLYALARQTETDMDFPESPIVKDLPGDTVGRTNYVTGSLSLDSRYLEPLTPAQRTDLYDTIVHEGLHLKYGPIYSLFNHDGIYREAAELTKKAEENIVASEKSCECDQ